MVTEIEIHHKTDYNSNNFRKGK